MKYGSVCSGVEAATVAWHPLGWTPAWFSEVDRFPSAVLAAHYPNTENRGDMTKFKEWPDGAIDLLVGGTPCQSFSHAGLRKGMADPRGNLALVFLALLDRARPKWVVWENVPGVLSSAGGRDFGSFVGGLGELGYGWAYRVLDAQYFGVPQRRRRVFVVGHLGDWRRAAAVLFERNCLQGNPTPSRQAGETVAPTIASRTSGGGGLGTDFDCDGGLVAETLRHHPRPGSNCLGATISVCMGSDPISAEEVALPMTNRNGDRGVIAFGCKDYAQDATEDISPTLRSMGNVDGHENGGGQVAIAFTQNQAGDILHGDRMPAMGTNQNATGRNTPKVMSNRRVRRLTPRECERLQGFPDDYTLITYRRRPAADGPRYKALGNSMAVPVMRWIGERIMKVQSGD